MEENKYPKLDEEDNIGKVSEPAPEPAFDYQTTEISSVELGIPDDWDPGLGPYSMEELNDRIDKAEVAINKAQKGDWNGWISESQSLENLYTKYPWLR